MVMLTKERGWKKCITSIQDMYQNSCAEIRAAVGVTEPFSVNVGVIQGSAHSFLLFALVVDGLTQHVRIRAPWN